MLGLRRSMSRRLIQDAGKSSFHFLYFQTAAIGVDHLLPYVRRLRTAGWINPPFHYDYFSGTHPRDFVIMTILKGAVQSSLASARL